MWGFKFRDPARTRQSSSAESENAGDRESQNGAADYRTAEGNLFMDIVDTDRSLLSVEQGNILAQTLKVWFTKTAWVSCKDSFSS